VKRFLFSSSACVYNQSKQKEANVEPLREEDAYPADPEPGYGWEKLFAEELCRYFRHDYGFETRIVRFHNVYGPLGTYDGGKKKLRLQCAAKSLWCRTVEKSKSGEMASRPVLHVRRRLRGRTEAHHGFRLSRSAEPGHT